MQKGGSQYGVPPPEMSPFGATRPPMVGNLAGPGQLQPGDASSPRPPAPPLQSNFEELAVTVTGNYTEDDPLGGGEEAERGVSGNRWPRQETLALLKIRSDMDATFRDATLKGPLWEEVSRKLAEEGYTRSAKKCKEKFENVHKYYKRTKDSRAARADGKSYRFFTQLEALHGSSSSSTVAAATTTVTAAITAAANTASIAANPTTTLSMTGARIQQPTPISAIPPTPPPAAAPPVAPVDSTAAAAAAGLSALGGGMSFSSNTSESESEMEDDDTEEGLGDEQRKRKREAGGSGGGGGGSRRMMAFFEGLMKQVMERQEAMQQKFLQTLEKREQDRMIREEAWRRQEMARLSHEHEVMSQERTLAASRDATIISFLEKITGQTVQLSQPLSVTAAPPPQPVAVTPAAPPPPPQPAPPPPQPEPTPSPPPTHPQPQSQSQPQSQQQQQQQVPPAPQQQQQQPQSDNAPQTKPAPMEIVLAAPEQVQESEAHFGSGSDPTSSRWPKAEVHALINIRAGMESRYQEAGPKGPLWEEISAAMKRMGFHRNAKRCKEKWENINKYFKKVKEGNKKRPEDAKTCPYFHQLDALYRNKIIGSGSGGGGGGESSASGKLQQQDPYPNVLPITTLPPPSNGGDGINSKNGRSPKAAAQVPTSNGATASFIQEPITDLMKKPEDIVKELMQRRRHPRYDFDKMDVDTEDDDDDDDDGMDEDEQKMAYKIEFQRPSMPSTAASNANGNKAARSTASGSFLAMVHQ